MRKVYFCWRKKSCTICYLWTPRWSEQNHHPYPPRMKRCMLIGCQGGTTMTKIVVIVITFHPDAANLDTMLCVKRLTELQESCSSVFQQTSLDRRRSKRQHNFKNGTNSVEMATKSPSPNICFIQLDLHTPCACNALVCARVDILDADLYNAFPHFLGTWSSCWAPSCLETSKNFLPFLCGWSSALTLPSFMALKPLKGEKKR